MNKQPNMAITRNLNQWQSGNSEALHHLMNATYDDLKRIACYINKSENANSRLPNTELLNEGFLRFMALRNMNWQDRRHYYNTWAGIMRRVQIDRARALNANKRGNKATHIPLHEVSVKSADADLDVVELCNALDRLAQQEELLSQIVSLRYFCGLTTEEVALALEISPATTKRKWQIARAWLYRELKLAELN